MLAYTVSSRTLIHLYRNEGPVDLSRAGFNLLRAFAEIFDRYLGLLRGLLRVFERCDQVPADATQYGYADGNCAEASEIRFGAVPGHTGKEMLVHVLDEPLHAFPEITPRIELHAMVEGEGSDTFRHVLSRRHAGTFAEQNGENRFFKSQRNFDFDPHEVGFFVPALDHQTFPVGADQNQHGIGGGNFVLKTVAKITRDLHALHIHENASWSVVTLESLINCAARTRRDPVGAPIGEK